MRVVYGRHPVEALLEARPHEARRLFAGDGASPRALELARLAKVPVERVRADRLQALAKTTHHQLLVAEAEDLPNAEVEDLVPADAPALVLALDSVQDPHNLGALVRSAECFGATGVVFPQDRSAPLSAVAAKASAGAVERLALAKVVNLARALVELKELGAWVVGLASEGPEALPEVDLTGPVVLVVGAEGEGLRPLVRRTCDRLARLPLVGRTGSLNASVAGGIALYEAFTQRARRRAK